jgi:glycogen debranching enzyme
MAVQDLGESLVIREGDIFLLTDGDGQIARGNRNGHGLYHNDMRYLSGYDLTFSTARPITLLSTAELGHSSEQVMTNPKMVDVNGSRIARGSLNLQRTRVIDGLLEERLEVHNHTISPVAIELQYRFSADFADMFEVRGWEAERRGVPQSPGFEAGALHLSARGADDILRETRVTFDPSPDVLVGDPDLAIATYRISLERQGRRDITLRVTLDGRSGDERADLLPAVTARHEEWRSQTTEVVTGNEFFDAIMARSLADIRMLWTETDHGAYPAAGTPWYDALFGRDSCIVATQLLAYRPSIARDVLSFLASVQGTANDPWRDEEPGKIPHELRRGELTNTGELPFSPYYGSIDSTPLFLMLAGEYLRWTGDRAFIETLSPNLEAALDWIKHSGDTNGDGYIDYEKRSVKGLVNQGWKDSWDSIVHRDGSLAVPPISLVEVQAYAYAGLVRLAEALGETDALLAWAKSIHAGLNTDFWMEDEGCFALAIGKERRVESVTTNAGHVLWAGAAQKDKALATAKRLLQPDMFSGWGVRTLSRYSPRYNPQGYHLGSVWPHDNSLLSMGLKRYDLNTELGVLAGALFEAAKTFQYYRLPELFGGSPLTTHQTPVPYPVACRPQAWAAGAIPLITQAFLGLCPDAANNRLFIVEPTLPPFLERARVSRLRLGPTEVDLIFEREGNRTAVLVDDVRGDAAVEVVGEWPEALR